MHIYMHIDIDIYKHTYTNIRIIPLIVSQHMTAPEPFRSRAFKDLYKSICQDRNRINE
jgi:hypothetical protein